MINISENDRALWRSGQTKKDVIVSFPDLDLTITNDDIVADSLELKESIESENSLSFKGCIASQFKISLINFVTDVRNEYIEVGIYTGLSDVIPLFKGYVYSQNNATHEDIQTTLICYDEMYKILNMDVTAWYNALSFPMTLKAFRNAFFTRVGVTQETTDLTNDYLNVAKTFTDATITGANIIRSICQVNGVFGQIDRYGVFKYRALNPVIEGLYPSETLYPSEDLYPRESNANERVLKSTYRSISYQPYHTSLITRVIIVSKSGTLQGQAGNDSGDTLYIADNPLAWGMNGNTIATNILGVIGGITYTPATTKGKGLPYLECGDVITANTNINIVETYILSRTLSGIQALFDEYDSDSTQYHKPYQLSAETKTTANEVATQTVSSNLAVTNSNLAMTNGNVTTLSNNVTQLGNVVANKANISDLNATNAVIENLSGTVATINRLYVTSATVSSMIADTVTANYITSKFTSASGASFPYLNASNIYTGSIRTGSLVMSDEGANRSFSPMTVSGHRVLGWR